MRLSPAERDALQGLEETERTVRRGTVLISENETARDLFVLRSGWLHSSVYLGNGSRQIMRLHFPADIVGLPLLAFPESPETVVATTDVTLSPFSRERLAGLFADQPRLAALVFASAVADRVSLADRLASIGRTSARARVASLLCEIFSRLGLIGTPDAEVQIPLTQEDMGDATGLTAVHVNRMMRRLVEDGIIERTGNLVRLKDKDRLCAEANFLHRGDIDISWLPQPR